MSTEPQRIDPSSPRWFKILTTVVEILAGVAGVILFVTSDDWGGKMLGAIFMLTGFAQLVALGIIVVRKRQIQAHQ